MVWHVRQIWGDIIGTKDGVVKARYVKSKDQGSAWDIGRVNDIRGTPWELVPGRLGVEIIPKIIMRKIGILLGNWSKEMGGKALLEG